MTFDPGPGRAVPPLVADPAGVRVERARFAPGATRTVPEDDVSLLPVRVGSGQLTVRSTATLTANRAATLMTPAGAARGLAAALAGKAAASWRRR